MSGDLNSELRAALRPVDPGEAFTRKVMSALDVEPPPRVAFLSERPVWLALAASLVLALAGAGLWQAQRARQGEEARRQLLEALRVTDQQLSVAYRAVNEPRALTEHSGT